MSIPKIIHHIAPKNKEKWHPIWIDCYNSWKSNFLQEEYKHVLWNDSSDIDLLIEKEYPHYWESYKNFPLHILKIDFARIALLYKYGGIYADMDLYCYKNFYNDLTEKDCYLVQCSEFDGHYDKNNELVANFLIASKPKSNFLGDLLEKTIKNINSYDKNVFYEEENSKYIVENSIIILSKLFKTYDKNLIGILPRNDYNYNMFEYHKNMKVKHMFTGMWGNEILEEAEQEYNKHIKNTQENISYSDFLKKIYKDNRSLDYNLFNYTPI